MSDENPPSPEMLDATTTVKTTLEPVLAALGFPKPHTCPTQIAFLHWEPCGYSDQDHRVFAYVNTNDSSGLNLSVTAVDVPMARVQLLAAVRKDLLDRAAKARSYAQDIQREADRLCGASHLMERAMEPPPMELSDESQALLKGP